MNSWLTSEAWRLWTSLVIAALAVPTARGQSAKRLWVLQQPDQIVEYDLVTSAVVRSRTVPRRLVEHPEYLSINAAGHMLFLPSLGVQWAAGDMATSADRAWFWDGRQTKEWKLEGPKTSGTRAGKPIVTETVRQWFLSAGGESLFWIEHKFEKIMDTLGVEHSVRTTAHVWRTSLAGDNPVEVATIAASGWCECTTGVCSESCPEWSFWAPNGVADDFFLATRMTEGQMGSRYHESVLYQHVGSRWVARKMPRPLQAPLAASEKGEILVTAVPDAGCCGWENQSSDQLLLLRSGKSVVLYDEQRRYDNRNYDVSFYASDARLFGNNTLLAYTLGSTARLGGEIRLSESGKENDDELARVRRTIAELPTVVIVQLGTTPQTAAAIARAGLVGWLSEREVLVAQNGRLTIYDARGIRQRDTTIRVRSAADSFLR